jgi:hypothetical protein
MLRFALHGQGQSSQGSTRCHGMPCRGSLPVLQPKKHNRFGYRLSDLNVRPSTDRPRGLLPPLNDRVSTRGVNR